MVNKNIKKYNKSQIGVFVLIAVIIVTLGVFFFTNSSNNFKLFSDQKASYKLKDYVQTCLDLETTSAINKIGQKGGWLYSPPLRFISKDTPDALIKSGKGLDFFGNKIPYWFYYDDLNKEFKYNIPEFDSNSRYSIRSQIKTYLDENLENNCIEGFKSFKEVYNIEYVPKEIKTKVEFKDKDIIVSLNLPLKITSINENKTDFIKDFKIKTPNKIYVPYYLAKDLIAGESKSFFVEKRILQFMNPYMSTEGRDLLPPFYDFKLKYDFAPWRVSKVKKLTKQIISSNIDLMKFYSTTTKQTQLPQQLQDSQFANGVYNAYNKDYLSENSLIKEKNPKLFASFKDYSVNPIFEFFFPLSFTLDPSLGNIILMPKAEAMISFLPVFFTTYTSVYEMHMPILFEIKDAKNINDNFVFNLLLEANIDYNAPLGERKDIKIDVGKLPSSKKSLICDPSQFISNYVSLNITDPIEHGNRKNIDGPIKGVDGAYVNFDCKGISTCFIGETKINGDMLSNNLTKLRFRLPIDCNPGSLEIYKPGYTRIKIDNLNPTLENQISIDSKEMYSLKEFDLKIKMVQESDSKYSEGRSLYENETGFLILTNLDDEELTQVVEFNRQTQDDLKVKLVPGNYSIEGFVLYNGGISIASKTMCFKKGMFSGESCQEIPGFDAESWMSGSLELKNVKFTFGDIFNNKQVTISILDFPLPSTYDELSNTVNDVSAASAGKDPIFE